MLSGSKVAEVVYDFTQHCFIGEKSGEPVDIAVEEGLFDVLASGPLTLLEVHQLIPSQRRLLKDLLTQYIMFLEMNRGLPLPSTFLKDSSKTQLGAELLEYICENKWPFPQMLPKHAHKNS